MALHAGRGIRGLARLGGAKASDAGRRAGLWLIAGTESIVAALRRWAGLEKLPGPDSIRIFFPDTPVARSAAVVCFAALGTAAVYQALRAAHLSPNSRARFSARSR